MELNDSWAELRQLVDSLKKKQLMKKPNWAGAIPQIKKLAEQMKDDEWGVHAAVCHCELANVYNKLGDVNEERKQWEKAADIIALAEREHLHSKSQVVFPWSDDASSCYLRAIRLTMNLKGLKLAGMISLKAAKHSLTVGNYIAAGEHGARAVRLLDGERMGMADALRVLAETQLLGKQFEPLLDTLDQLWTLAMKSWTTTPMGREILKEAEVATVLICCNRKPRQGRHTVLMQMYTKPCSFDDTGFIVVPSDTVLSDRHFLSFSALVRALSRSQKERAIALYDRQCREFFSPLCRKMFLQLVREI